MRGHIRKRGEGAWQVIYDAPRKPDGCRNQIRFTVKGGRKDAERELWRVLRELDLGSYTEPSKITVGEFLQKWLADYAKAKVNPKVYDRYEEIVRLHLAPALGHHQLDALRPLHIQAAYTRWLESGRRDGRGGLSAQTVLSHHRVLHKALEMAVKWDLLPRNPVDGAEPPRPQPKEKPVLDEGQIAQLLRQARGHQHYVPFLIAVTTGLRRGEICGLRWCDVDLATGKLTVCRSIGQTRHGTHIKEPKTAKRRRVVDLPAFVVKALIRHKGLQAEHRLLMGSAYQNTDLVIAEPDGSLVKPNNLTKTYTVLRRKLGLPVTLHGLRHTHASHLMREAVHIKVVSERLGHSRVGFTLDTYSHLLPSQQEEAARRIDVSLREAMGE